MTQTRGEAITMSETDGGTTVGMAENIEGAANESDVPLAAHDVAMTEIAKTCAVGASSAKPVSWREVLPIHPAAELFPPLPPDELRALGEDVKANGMRMPVTLFHQRSEPHYVLLDGVSRCDALEMVGLDVPALLDACRKYQPRPELWVEWIAEPGVDSTLTDHETDPYDYGRSVNFHHAICRPHKKARSPTSY